MFKKLISFLATLRYIFLYAFLVWGLYLFGIPPVIIMFVVNLFIIGLYTIMRGVIKPKIGKEVVKDKFITLLFIVPVYTYFNQILVNITYQSHKTGADMYLKNQGDYPLISLLLIVLISPVAEEILFRELFYKKLRRRTGLIQATVINALAFSSIHGTLPHMVSVVTLSLCLSYIYEVSDFNINYPILVHILYNVSCIFIAGIGLKDINLIFVLIAIFFLLFLYYYFVNKSFKKKNPSFK